MSNRLRELIRLHGPLKLASVFSFCFVIAKMMAYMYTGSLLVLTSLLDSTGDSLVSYLNHRVSKIAQAAPDTEHPWGHAGFEVISSLTQGMFIVSAGLFVGIECVNRLLSIGVEQTPPNALFASIFLGGAAFAAWLIDRFLTWAQGDNTQKALTLETDQAHYRADVWMNGAAALGLLFAHFTGYIWIDAMLGLFGAILVTCTALPILKRSFSAVTHKELTRIKQQAIVDVVHKQDRRIKGVHRLRTRELGSQIFIDFHMTLPAGIALSEAHTISDQVEEALKTDFGPIDVLIHIDPDNLEDERDWEPSYTPLRRD